jgi:GH24 family phage-related lysozyme (muramidase)
MSEARRVWPGVELLHTNAQAALTSLVYNRGASMKDIDSRREMRLLGPAIKARDYDQIAQLIRGMKRLWPNVRGLLARRELEAVMVERQ